MRSYRETMIAGVLIVVSSAGIGISADKRELINENEMINYSVGYQIGGDFKKQGVKADPELLVQGVKDALEENPPLLPREQMNRTLSELKRKITLDQQQAEKRADAEYKKASAAFLKENAAKEGVVTLPSGVQYKVLQQGAGNKPALQDEVKVHYRIIRVDGQEVGNTYIGGKPRTFPVTKTYPALQEVLLLMSEGSKWQIVVPAGSGPGDREQLEKMGVIIYEFELLTVVPATSTSVDSKLQKEIVK